jgi:hypothetical protein
MDAGQAGFLYMPLMHSEDPEHHVKVVGALQMLLWVMIIEEGRAASKSPHLKIGYFISLSQQAVSVNIIPNSAVGIFSPNTEGTKE